MSMTAILVPVFGPPELTTISDYTDIGRLVGGWIEAVPVYGREHDLRLFINECGKFECVDENGGVLVNIRMTRWLTNGNKAIGFDGNNLMPGDVIAGDAVLLGFDPDTGESQDCPDDIVRALNLEVTA